MKILILATATILLISFNPVLAGFEINQATTHPADCYSPAVASSPDGLTMLAYGAQGEVILMDFVTTQLVPTVPLPGEVWPEPVTMNAGYAPAICWTREGFVLAFNSAGMIMIYQSDLEGNWDLDNLVMLESGGAVMGIDLLGVATDAAGPYVFMTVQMSTDPPGQDYKVLYAAGTLFGWTDLEVVAEEPAMMPHPQITWSIGPAGPWPTIFYLTGQPGEGNLVYTTKDLVEGWSTPVTVPGDGASGPAPFGGEFDVVTTNLMGFSRNLLGLGPQPTCPCGTIHFLASEPGTGWLPQENLTVYHDEMDWPMSPCLDADPAGNVHAFWHQQGSVDLQPVTRTLEYWVKTGAGWVEAGGFLDGQEGAPLGSRVALDISLDGNVVMAWTRRDTIDEVPQPQQVWIARPHEPSDVPGSEIPRSAVALTAWPNPFNPSVSLAMETPVSGSASLDVFDVRGRLVVRLFDGLLSEGRREVTWDGKNAEGHPTPSGIYFARLETEAGRAVRKLVLAE